MENVLSEIAVTDMNGSEVRLSQYLDKVLLIVNVASKCGLTPQYAGLESLYARYKDQGLVVLGFPANEFGAQEPGSNADILAFCHTTYDVHFPVFQKIVVKGEGQHPLYRALTQAVPEATSKAGSVLKSKLRERGLLGSENDISWNFEKFLIGRAGRVEGRFAPDIEPQDPLLVEAIERELEAKR